MVRFLFVFILSAGAAWAQPRLMPEQWPGRVWSDITNEVDRSGAAITNVIFDQLDDFEFKKKYDGVTGKVGIQRSVYDNQDVLNTWTVKDSFKIDLSADLEAFSFPLVPSVTSPVALNLGVGGKLMVHHIRQVRASKYHELPTVENVKAEIKRDRWAEFDPSMRPRFGKLWNPLLNLYRIPWTTDGLKKLKSGEIIAYSTSGYVSVGLETGFLPLKLPVGVDLSVGVGVQAFVKGEFRITLLKEDERFVRVKVTRVKSAGTGATIGAETSKIELYEGYLLFEGTKVQTRLLATDITVVPFKFVWEEELKKQFDLGYRFDLEDPGAQEAFEKAMRGNFKAAGLIAGEGKPVTHLITRNSFEKRRARSLKLGTDWLIRAGRTKQKRDQWITLERPDGKNEIFKSSFELSKSWSTFWGSGEKKNFLFTTLFDQGAWERGEPNSYQLVTEVLYQDVYTTGKEMQSYISDVEAVIGNEDVLPELPILVPDEDDELKVASYRRSSFYFGQYISQKQLLKFLMTDPARAWEISLTSFDYKKGRLLKKWRAKRFYNHWMRLQTLFRKPLKKDELAEALKDLRSLFGHHRNALEALKAIVLALDKEEIDFFLTASNLSFGRIQFNGRVATNAERLLKLADDTVEFENQVGRQRSNPEAEVKELKITQQTDRKIKITFTLPENPQYMYFKLLRTSGWKRVKTLKEFVFFNNERFKAGVNTWIIAEDTSDPLELAVLEAFKATDYYTLQLSVSPNRTNWGRVSSSRFRYRASESTEM